MMNSEYPTSFLHVDNHINGDAFQIPETVARAAWYEVNGGPTAVFDGLSPMAVGAWDTCAEQHAWYVDSLYTPRWNATAGLAPVSIQGYYAVGANQLMIKATYHLEDPVTLTDIRATLFLAESHVFYKGSTYFDHVTRKIYDQNITLTNVGDSVAVQTTITLNAGWNPANFEVIAIVQTTSGTKEVYQAAALPRLFDFRVAFALPVRSVPNGNGEPLFAGTIKNVGELADVLNLSVDTGFGWPTAFQVGNDPTWYTDPQPLSLAAGDSAAINVKVTTDDVKRIGDGNLLCQSEVTGLLAPIRLLVYNKAYSILFVDDDGNNSDETPFTTALAQLGRLYENWDVHNGHADVAPSASNMAGYDVVVWQTGYAGPAVGTDDQSALMAYLDAGGNLYMSNMDLTTTVYPPNIFAVNYLGMASRTLNVKGYSAIGVPGDPITSGMSIPLTFMSEGFNKVDNIGPTATAHTIFRNENGCSNALANQLAGGARVVFNTIVQNAFDPNGSYPNSNEVVIQKAITWLSGQDVTSAPEEPVVFSRLTVVPNPCTGSTDLRFSLSPRASAGAVRLTMVDVAGRHVRTLVEGRMKPGTQILRWNGADDLGRALPSGIYFSRLQTADGTKTQKVTLTR
jgi:hypothetical protein